MTRPFPVYTRAELLADGVVHMLGVAFSIVAVAFMLFWAVYSLEASGVVCVAVYGVATIAVFLCSAAYNMAWSPSRRAILRRLDHAAIFLKIAGTYTPFAALSLGGAVGAALLGAVWTIAAVGVPIALFAHQGMMRSVVWLYLAQGWIVILAIGPLAAALSVLALALLVAGGLLYTVGVAFHLWEKLKYHNAIWHGFVLAASACMYGAVWAALPTGA